MTMTGFEAIDVCLYLHRNIAFIRIIEPDAVALGRESDDDPRAVLIMLYLFRKVKEKKGIRFTYQTCLLSFAVAILSFFFALYLKTVIFLS